MSFAQDDSGEGTCEVRGIRWRMNAISGTESADEGLVACIRCTSSGRVR
jgi:SLT domain-containing protein